MLGGKAAVASRNAPYEARRSHSIKMRLSCYSSGKPRIIGTRIPVAAIAEMYFEMGESLKEIAAKYDVSKIN